MELTAAQKLLFLEGSQELLYHKQRNIVLPNNILNGSFDILAFIFLSKFIQFSFFKCQNLKTRLSIFLSKRKKNEEQNKYFYFMFSKEYVMHVVLTFESRYTKHLEGTDSLEVSTDSLLRHSPAYKNSKTVGYDLCLLE